MTIDDRLTADESAAAAATQADDTECVCGHPRSDHGDGIVHTACCGINPALRAHGHVEVRCECDEFEVG